MTTVQTTTIGQLLAAESPAATAVIDGEEAVVIAQGEDDQAWVYRTGLVRPYHVDTPATGLRDPERQIALLREALLLTDGLRRETAAQHSDVLSSIRDYAIERQQDGTICLTGLNEFLRMFGMPEYEP